MPSEIFRSGLEAILDDREWSSGPPGCLGVVERPSWMSGSGRVALLDVLERSGDPFKGPGVVGGPPGCPGVVGRPSRMFGSGREAIKNAREWSGIPPRCSGVVGMPSQMSGSSRDALPHI